MQLTSLAALLFATTSAALDCGIRLEGNALCRSCPSTRCDIVHQFRDRREQIDFTCAWKRGEEILRTKTWVYHPRRQCFVALRRTSCDENLLGDCFVQSPLGLRPASQDVTEGE
ncbi:hypothetical protein VTI28DRAFT_563 [Corynascus sepedonium]